jgi:hypothetical protein
VMLQKCGIIIFTYGKGTRKLLLTPNERCWGLVELRNAPAHSPRPYDHCCWGRYCCHDVLTVWLCSIGFENIVTSLTHTPRAYRSAVHHLQLCRI